MEFVPSRTRLIETELSNAKLALDRGYVPRYRLAIPMLFKPTIAVFVYEGCEACPIALAHAMVLESSDQAKAIVVDCSEIERMSSHPLSELCQKISSFPAIVAGTESDVVALVTEGRGSRSLVYCEGVAPYPSAIADLVLTTFIAARFDDVQRILPPILAAAARRGLILDPDPIKMKKFVVQLIKLKDVYGEPRCPCRPRVATCPCPDGLAMAQRTGRCYCGYIVKPRQAPEPKQIEPLLGWMSLALLVTNVARLVVGSERAAAAMVRDPSLALRALRTPVMYLPAMLSNAMYGAMQTLNQILSERAREWDQSLVVEDTHHGIEATGAPH